EPGASGIDTLLPLVLRLVEAEVLPLHRALATVTVEPARLLGLEGGRLGLGGVADLVVVDPVAPWFCTRETLTSRGHNSPFLGWEFSAGATHTLVGGRLIRAADRA
ncbi:amidohydrolase family protein, partial [Spiribacter roseus]|uniref:amidohydrolase family protein n=1 Tax=Spiribacter roseus TaxID=1855875 RepID=UPI001330CB5D